MHGILPHFTRAGNGTVAPLSNVLFLNNLTTLNLQNSNLFTIQTNQKKRKHTAMLGTKNTYDDDNDSDVGECQMCGESGPLGTYCTVCEGTGMIYLPSNNKSVLDDSNGDSVATKLLARLTGGGDKRRKFKRGDRIVVISINGSKTKHAGQKATVKKVGLGGRLTVNFDDPYHKGRYVDSKYARLVDVGGEVRDDQCDAVVDEVEKLLSQLAVTSAMAVNAVGGKTNRDRKEVAAAFKAQFDAAVG